MQLIYFQKPINVLIRVWHLNCGYRGVTNLFPPWHRDHPLQFERCRWICLRTTAARSHDDESPTLYQLLANLHFPRRWTVNWALHDAERSAAVLHRLQLKHSMTQLLMILVTTCIYFNNIKSVTYFGSIRPDYQRIHLCWMFRCKPLSTKLAAK